MHKSIIAKLNINAYASIDLDSLYFHNFCSSQNNNNNNNNYDNQISNPCQLYIYVVQSKSAIKYQKDSQYIISAKSSQKTGKILLSGQVITGEIIMPNTIEHFFM